MFLKANPDKVSLISSLQQMSLHPPSNLMVHASLSSLGLVEGGAETVVSALREITGSEGSLIIPSFRDAIRADYYSLRECRNCFPRELCPSREQGYTGIIGETVRKQTDSLRSCHPTHSWVGVGKGAKFLLEGHYRSLTPCGKDSPFFRLLERDGKILLLGVGVNSLTNVHAVEDARNLPYISAIDPPHRHATYTTSGIRMQYVYPELLFSVLREAGIMHSGRIGAGLSHVLSARALGSFLWVVTEDDPWCLILRPRKDEYKPFTDACMKAARMISAWKANHDLNAWRLLLEESLLERKPFLFHPSNKVVSQCPAYRGIIRKYHRCAANDIPPWEKFEDYPTFEPGVATCDQCNWPLNNQEGAKI